MRRKCQRKTSALNWRVKLVHVVRCIADLVAGCGSILDEVHLSVALNLDDGHLAEGVLGSSNLDSAHFAEPDLGVLIESVPIGVDTPGKLPESRLWLMFELNRSI